jgi:hypothetical protein
MEQYPNLNVEWKCMGWISFFIVENCGKVIFAESKAERLTHNGEIS